MHSKKSHSYSQQTKNDDNLEGKFIRHVIDEKYDGVGGPYLQPEGGMYLSEAAKMENLLIDKSIFMNQSMKMLEEKSGIKNDFQCLVFWEKEIKPQCRYEDY